MKAQDKRNHKVKSDFGKADYYKHYSKTAKNPLSKEQYYKILDEYLNRVHNMIGLEGVSYNIPQRLGKIQLRKSKNVVKLKPDGTIKNTLAINWKATKDLWLKNPRAKERKIKIRYTNEHTDGYVFKLVYLKYNANYKNKSAYKMSINREMRRLTNIAVTKNNVDAFILN